MIEKGSTVLIRKYRKPLIFVVESISDGMATLCGRVGAVPLADLEPYDAKDVIPVHGGKRSLYCPKCRVFVCDTANYEMKREGFYSHSHICGVPDSSEIPL